MSKRYRKTIIIRPRDDVQKIVDDAPKGALLGFMPGMYRNLNLVTKPRQTICSLLQHRANMIDCQIHLCRGVLMWGFAFHSSQSDPMLIRIKKLIDDHGS